jgi:hypothetical protein
MTSTTTDRRSGVSTPGAASDRLTGVSGAAAYKAPCKVATTANISLSGLQSIDGVTLVADDRVLVKDQTTASQNGIYIASSGNWERAPDWDDSRDVIEGTRVWVTDGSVNDVTEFVVTSAGPITPGTTSVTIVATATLVGFVSSVSPAFTGTPTAPTAAPGTDTTQISTTAFVTAAVAAAVTALKNGVSTAFDTLAEIATALGRAAYLDVEEQVLTGGARVTSKSLGTITTGTLTLDPGDRPHQHYTNNGAHTLAPGSNGGTICLQITNGASAGAITTSGYTKVVGAFTTTNGDDFICTSIVINGFSLLTIQALQ